jgi:WD40 repeat protein
MMHSNKNTSYLAIEDVELKEEKTFFSHTRAINKVKALTESEFISCSLDKTIKFWKTRDCKEYRSLKVSGYVNSILPLYLEDTHHQLIVIGYSFDSPTNGHISLYDL